MLETLIERLTRYAKIDTQSDPKTTKPLPLRDNGIYCMSWKKK